MPHKQWNKREVGDIVKARGSDKCGVIKRKSDYSVFIRWETGEITEEFPGTVDILV